MYQCELCGTVFDRPRTITQSRPDADGCREHMEKCVCPICGEARFFPVEPCSCGGWKPRGDTLCTRCRQGVRESFSAYCDSLTEAEQEVLDDMLDGMSIHDRAAFC